jgi:hypothetical protein
MDPHQRSATIEVMTGDESIVVGGRFGTGRVRNGLAVATPPLSGTAWVPAS